MYDPAGAARWRRDLRWRCKPLDSNGALSTHLSVWDICMHVTQSRTLLPILTFAELLSRCQLVGTQAHLHWSECPEPHSLLC